MSSRAVFFTLLFAASALGAKRAPRRPDPSVFTTEIRTLAGCKASMSACYAACPDHRAEPRREPETCDVDSTLPVACYCLFQGET